VATPVKERPLARSANLRIKTRERGPRDFAFNVFCFFVVSYFLHFAARIPPLGVIRIDILLALMVALAILMAPKQEKAGQKELRSPVAEGINHALVILLVYIVVTLPFVEYTGSVLRNGFENFIKSVCFYFFIVATVDTPKKLRTLLFLYVGCQVFRVLEPLYMHITDGYWGSNTSMEGWQVMDRLSGSPYDIINPNGLGFLVVTILPMLHYVCPPTTGIRKILWAVIAGAMAYALILSSSRSSFLALIFLALVVIIRSKHRAGMLVAGALAGLLAVSVMSPLQRERYLSIVSHDARGAGTAEGRINGLYSDLAVAMKRPFFGFGLGSSGEANSNFGGTGLIAHNLYLEVAQELGFIGLILFLSLLWKFVRSCYAMKAAVARTPVKDLPDPRDAADFTFLSALSESLLVQIIVYLFFSIASYGLSEPYWYFIGGLCVVAAKLTTQMSNKETQS
jgi:O-antigen ligase